LGGPNPSDDEGLWTRLRRRKVVQWGIAYVAAGWGLLQGLEYLGTVFHWPEQLQRWATIGFLVGAPIAFVLAWYHGERGHQKVSGTEFTVLTVLLLLGGGMFWWVGRMPEAPVATVAAPAAQAPAAAEAGTSIAVLPFVNMSPDKDNEYFSDGISEELLNVLVRVPGLGVASRTSSFAYKGSPLGTAEIARALKVNHVLEGSVRKSGNHVRITAQLIDAVNDRHLWSETYDRELTDIFAIQADIANEIVGALQGQLGGAKAAATVSVRADTENLEAYQLYLKARELFIARKDLPESIRLFEQVTTLDPNFARGWEGLAAVCSVANSWGITDRDYPEMATKAARRALELDPTLSMPWAALANTGMSSLPVDWAKHIVMLDRAIAADEHNSTAFLWRGIAWINIGFHGRAVADFDRCLVLDSGYQNCKRWKAMALLYLGKADTAVELFRQGLAAGFVRNRDSSFVPTLVWRGDLVGATLLLSELGAGPEVGAILLRALQRPGSVSSEDVSIVERELAENARPGNQSIEPARMRLWLGEYDRIADASDFTSDTIVQWEPGFPGFRNSTGFKDVLRRIGVPDYWRAHGYPPQCHAVGASDFSCD
jgi:adenylate cyclase